MDINSTKEVATGVLASLYASFSGAVPEQYRIFLNLGFYILIIFLYALFIWRFYRFLARRDILSLDLSRYNTSTHPGVRKFLAAIFFIIVYIIILPFITFFWFALLAFFLLFLAKSQSLSSIILISAAVVSSIRLTAYISEDLSKDLSKMLPFTLLGFFIIDPDFFSVNDFILRISEIPNFFTHILLYVLFIIVLELVLRGLFTIVDLFISRNKNQ